MQIVPPFEAELEAAARARQKSVAELLEEIVREWLGRHQEPQETDEVRQEQLRAAAMKLIGTIERDDLSAENASSEIKTKLARRYAG
jgi:hypothetical protein